MKRVYPKEDYCLGCRLCETYCAAEHSPSKDVRKLLREHSVERIAVGYSGDTSFALQCRHCREPACVEACMTGAMEQREDGVVLVNQDKCVSCWMCAMACPFGAIRCRTTALKCDLCPDREAPACVENCPSGAIACLDEEGFAAWLEPEEEPVIIEG